MFNEIINFVQNNTKMIIAIIVIIIILFIIYKYYFSKTKSIVSESYNNLNNDLKIINFNTSWCGYSKQFQPVWDEFAKKMQGKPIEVVDMKCDEKEEMCAKYDVPGYPYVILFKEGKQIVYDGDRTVNELETFVNKHLV
jgi:thiol-disulfide isomerase/thioredoxin